MGWLPTEREDVLIVATPLFSVTAAPRLTPLSRNWTVPVGVPAVEVTVAVKVTEAPEAEGLTDEVRTVPVLLRVMSCTTAPEVVAAKFVSPLYWAVMLCWPPVSDEVETWAVPLTSV